MHLPAIDDTIVSVSSGWEPAPLGVVRLSGPESFALARGVGACPPAAPAGRRTACNAQRLRLDRRRDLPATVLWFRRPRSYTGQDLVELHTVGCLPLLRALTARLIELGARRALPGEFTVRAYLLGKLDAAQAEGVLRLIHAQSESSARHAARLSAGGARRPVEKLTGRLSELLALIEAGIDFAEEQDVRLVSGRQVCRALDDALDALRALGPAARPDWRAGQPHVALAGLPNAGKSTLFNRLVGYERSIVSPVLGTTRDVLSAELRLNGRALVLQDCAGLGASAAELRLAARRAAEQAAEQADLVLWVHDCTAAWDGRETAACARIPGQARLLVRSKCDLPASPAARPPPGLGFAASVDLSATCGRGLGELRRAIARHLAGRQAVPDRPIVEQLGRIRACLSRAREVAGGSGDELRRPEIVALELRSALEWLADVSGRELSEGVLRWIFSQFCIGK